MMSKRDASYAQELWKSAGSTGVQSTELIRDSNIVKIVEAIKSVGPRNCSLISRMTGIPIETVRYKIKKQLLRKGITFHAVVDYELLGLRRYWITMDFSEGFRGKAPQILDALSKFGLIFYARLLPHSSYETMVAIPPNALGKYVEIMDRMVSSHTLRSYNIEPLSWVQYVSLRPEYYDFDKGRWSFSWSSLVPLTIRPNPLQRVPDPGGRLDVFDLFILKELQINSMTHLTSMARKLGIGSKTLRYHYVYHVLRENLLAGYAVRWSGISRTAQGTVVLLIRVANVEPSSIPQLEEAPLKLPFTWLQSYSEQESVFTSVLTLPASEYVNVLSFLASTLPECRDRTEVMVLDTNRAMSYTVPYEMFDPERGWHLNASVARAALEHAAGKPQLVTPDRTTIGTG